MTRVSRRRRFAGNRCRRSGRRRLHSASPAAAQHNVYVAETVYADGVEEGMVVMLATGSNTHTALPFAGLGDPRAVAVDGAGHVYVADHGTAQIVKLASA